VSQLDSPNYNATCLYCGIGETERAIQHLQISLNHGTGFQLKDWIENDSDLDPIRNHPKFQELVEKLVWSNSRPKPAVRYWVLKNLSSPIESNPSIVA